MKKQLKSKTNPTGNAPKGDATLERYLTPCQIGPWLLGTNKTCGNARETAISRITSARLGGWKEPNPFENSAIRRAHELRAEALAALDVYADYEMATGLQIEATSTPLVKAFPHGYDEVGKVGVTVRVPGGPQHCRNRSHGMETDHLWDCVAHLAIIAEADSWYGISYSPPLLPLIWKVDRSAYADVIAKICQALPQFAIDLQSAIDTEMTRKHLGMVWEQPQPISW